MNGKLYKLNDGKQIHIKETLSKEQRTWGVCFEIERDYSAPSLTSHKLEK